MPSLISDVKELKKCKDRVDRFKKERPKMAKMLGLGKGKTTDEEIAMIMNGEGIFGDIFSAIKSVAEKTVGTAKKVSGKIEGVLNKFGLSTDEAILIATAAAGMSPFSPYVLALRGTIKLLKDKPKKLPPGLEDFDEAEVEEFLAELEKEIQKRINQRGTSFGSSDVRASRQTAREKALQRRLSNFDRQVEKAKEGCKRGNQRDCRFVEDAPMIRRRRQLGEGKMVGGAVGMLKFIRKHPNKAKKLGFGKDDADVLQKTLADIGLDPTGPRKTSPFEKTVGLDKDKSDIGVMPYILNKTVDVHNKLRGKKKDPKDIKLEKGETHAIFKNKDGALARAQFCGQPGPQWRSQCLC